MNQERRYRQPPPKRPKKSNNGGTPQQGQRKSTSNSIRPKMPLYQEVLIAMARAANTLGELLISDRFVGMMQRIFQEHLDFLNYILKNMNSSKFWVNNLKYSIILSITFLIKGIFSKSLITFEVFVVIGAISIVWIKILDSKGDIIEVNESGSDYSTHEVRGETYVPLVNEEYGEELVDSDDEDEIVLPIRPTVPPSESKENVTDYAKEEPKPSNQDILDTIKQMHGNIISSRSSEPSTDLLRDTLERMPEVRQKMQYNSVIQQMQERSLLNEAMNPIKDLIAGKDSSTDNSRYQDLLERINITK